MEALKKTVSDIKASQTVSNRVYGGIVNLTGKDLQLNYIQAWSGFWVNPGPSQYLDNKANTLFTHQGTAPDGSKVGIKYTSTDGLEWIVAWYAPIPSDTRVVNKAYYVSGKSGTLPSWEQIEACLDGSGTTSGGYANISSGGENAIFVASLK